MQRSKALLAFVGACVAVAAVVTLCGEDSSPVTRAVTREENHPSSGFSKPKPRKWLTGEKTTPHQNIVNLKAYAVEAFDQVKIYALSEATKSKQMGIILQILLRYGKHKMKKKIVMEYADIMGKLRARHPIGLGNYFLNSMNDALLRGTGALIYSSGSKRGSGLDENYGDLILLDSKAMGMTSRPRYFSTIAVRLVAFLAMRAEVYKRADNADAYAAVQYLKDKKHKRYKTFFAREMLKVRTAQAKLFKKIWQKAKVAEIAAFKKLFAKNHKAKFKLVRVQTPAGTAAAVETAKKLGWLKDSTFPTVSQIKAAADKKARAFLKHVKRSQVGLSTVVSKLESKAKKPLSKKAQAKKDAKGPKCIGWREVTGCNPKSKVVSKSSCSKTIGDAKAGYCECRGNKKLKVGCAHAEFTCKEMCDFQL
jgi:hypothetical protein